jgi:serine/threonine protein phosphatase 1
VPEGELIYAVGDIHGRSDLLAELLLKIEADAAMRLAAKKRLIFLGDYVDRGPDSRGVVEILLHGLPSDFSAHFLKGNHEALLLGFLADASRLDQWRYNGGEETMASYGVDVGWLKEVRAGEAFASALPATHLHFLQGLDLLIPADDYLFVHAGVRPGVPLEAQSETDLIWIRDEFLGSTKSFGKVVVHGHTPALEPVMRPNRIGIDTGAVFSGRLTALRLQDGERSFLET